MSWRHALEHDCYFGVWYNTENKKIYFDSNKYFLNLKEAVDFAIENEQLEIWDFEQKTSQKVEELRKER